MPRNDACSSENPSRIWQAGIVIGSAFGLTWIFWSALWLGGGLIGGDVYSYYFPQKTFLAEQLQQGVLPLWNSQTGFGYPLLGESQTGLLYPFHLVCYRLFEVGTAYTLVHLIHYVLTFCFTWMYARRLTISIAASLFSALIFTYSWFPTRVCLEWAIITGMYFPASLWAIECFLQENRKGYLLLLTLFLGLQLLAGHYNLAFITQLTLLLYVPFRIFQKKPASQPATQSVFPWQPLLYPLVILAGCIVFAYLLAAVQLLPSWELKQLSQRSALNDTFQPGYGHIPPLYLSQIIAPWLWYAPDIDTDRAIQNLTYGAIASGTNKVEAHLYFGMLPLILIAINFFRGNEEQSEKRKVKSIWFWLGALALLYATGWPLILLKHVPGFAFFQGPGRYGIVTTMAVAIWAGIAYENLMAANKKSMKSVVLIIVFSLTIADFWLVSRLVTYSVVVQNAAITRHGESKIARIVQAAKQPVRVWGPGPNMLNNLGLAQYPVYLGIGPAQYFDTELMLPTSEDPNQQSSAAFINQQVDWLRRAGITHIIRFEPLSEQWPVKLLFQGFDRVLNPAWGRMEPIYLYELLGARGRVVLLNAQSGDKAEIENYSANQIDIATHIPWIPHEEERTVQLLLTDLVYPGWEVTIDGKPATPEVHDDLFRSVELQPGQSKVRWRYNPGSYRWGHLISLMALAVYLVLWFVLCRARPRGNHSEAS